MSAIDDLINEGPVTIDGGFATELEALDYDLSSDLWSARLLEDGRDRFLNVAASIAAIAPLARAAAASPLLAAPRSATAANLQRATLLGVAFLPSALPRGGDGLPFNPHDLSPLVAASLGPYGAMMANGQEYTGDYEGAGVEEIFRFHRPRVAALLGPGPDVLAWETIPNLLEADAIARLQDEFAGPAAWVSFQCRDGGHIADGSPIEDAIARIKDAPGIRAVGCNCTAPEHVLELIERCRAAAPDLAVIVYPNDGRVWDGMAREWAVGGAGGFPADTVRTWAAAGATLIGGCCGVTPAGIAAIAATLGP